MGLAASVKVKILGVGPPEYAMEYTTSASVQMAEVTVNLFMFIELEGSPTVYAWSAGAVPVAIETSVAELHTGLLITTLNDKVAVTVGLAVTVPVITIA